ncbi:hypothetical protein IWW34DRAFT_144155 [Fusarium oxysporum f. sp. albedinis]|nr:hypothetical protein IWW34DRAFT_144155 [Fusarium oxysporum f. sp. albedinis]
MTGLATYTDAIVTLRPSQLQKLESLGLYYNSPEPAIICIKCGFAINPTLLFLIVAYPCPLLKCLSISGLFPFNPYYWWFSRIQEVGMEP